MRPLVTFPAVVLLALSFAGCAANGSRPYANRNAPKPLAQPAPATYVRPCASEPTTPEAARDCDRRSILAMAGEYRVRFAFDETAALAPGYAPHDAQRSGGTELVVAIVDDGDTIVLQHILVLGKDHVVVKHWRQDWQYQPASVLRFRGNGRFEREAVPEAAARGAWSQTVYEVDDAPRYAGIGRWTHADGVDAWESDRSWRPLPRREYTKRSDYQVLEMVNRHTLTPGGWVHEQDNTKIALHADGSTQALARERGINSYTRITDYDFTAGRDYWKATAAFWAQVRAEWERIFAAEPGFSTSPEPNGEPRIEELFKLADRAAAGQTIASSEIRALLDRYVKPVAAAPAG
jgi:hypothetical protein